MELLGVLYPDVFPFQPAGWKAGITHPAIISRSPAVDHVVPVVYGEADSEDNLVTACTPCNTIKSDFSLEMLGWELRPVEESEWDGLTHFYPRAVGSGRTTQASIPPGLDEAIGIEID